MHKIRLDEPGEGERALDDFVGIVRQAQQQKSYEGDRNLNANGVLGGAQEVADFQGLFDPSKEQLDGPSTLVQIGNFLCARGQIIGEDPQHPAGLDHNPNFTDQTRHRVGAGSCEPFGKVPGSIAQDRRCGRDRPILDDRKRGIGLEARDDATARLIERRPPAIIVIAEVENVGRSRFDRHLLSGRDVIDVGWRHHEIERLVGIGIVDDVRFGAVHSRRKRRPIAAQVAQPYPGRIDQTDTITDFTPISALQLRHQGRQQASKDLNRTRSIGRRKRRPRHGAATEVIKLARMASQVRFDPAQTSQAAKLPIQHRNQMSLGSQAARIATGAKLLHKPIDDPPRNMLQKPVKNDILVLHGLDPFRVQMIRNQLEPSRINAVHPFKHETCRTLVGQARR